jgi:hypothetical protein
LGNFFSLRVVAEETDKGMMANNVAFTTVKPGDRVVFSIDKHELDGMGRRGQVSAVNDEPPSQSNIVDDHVAVLRQAGVMVELREVNDTPDGPMKGLNAAVNGLNSNTRAEDMTTASVWKAFLAQEVERGSMTNATRDCLQKHGMKLVDEVLGLGVDAVGDNYTSGHAAASSSSSVERRTTDFQLHSVTIEGFGPFRDKISYPLLDRGLVLLRGSNRDGGADR